MCYSKEVTLTASIIIFSLCAYYYYKYVYKTYNAKKASADIKHLKPFFINVILAFLCIGGFNFLEFLSIATGNEIIFKIGLIVSISSMYFLIKSLEKLTHNSFYSVFFIPIILGVAIHIFSAPAVFLNVKFWVRAGENTLLWATVWITLFFHWNLCAFYLILKSKPLKKKILGIYVFETLVISYLLAVGYGGIAVFFNKSLVDSIKDVPSIWCVFFVVQILFLPHLFKIITKYYKANIKEATYTVSLKEKIILLIISSLLFLWFYLYGPNWYGGLYEIITCLVF